MPCGVRTFLEGDRTSANCSVCDWNRIARKGIVIRPSGSSAWAVEAGADDVDEDFWRTLEVERFTVSPAEYLGNLEQLLSD